SNCLDALDKFDGAVPGIPVADTLRRFSENLSAGTIDRSQYILTQTPQCFQLPILRQALIKADEDGFVGTDDASCVERLPGTRVTIVSGEASNFKVTTSEDLYRAETMANSIATPGCRCGEGFDAHRYATGRDLILGGVKVPFDLGLHGHSDADVLCHAIGDALLGSVALGDLGVHFPDSDPQYEGVSSIELLRKIAAMVADRGYQIVNIDATLILQFPKIAPYRDEMRENIAAALSLALDAVSVKATTTEGMGPFGRGEGIACRAVALVVKTG
ncbi:2-C-methyl-D-erythritol 2,4-cyclodiphosphate synthase, partial [bacterium]|nr:2-C-methyl-D-erythritol 2,4-cyclodiphosphate synthase [bacterium]